MRRAVAAVTPDAGLGSAEGRMLDAPVVGPFIVEKAA